MPGLSKSTANETTFTLHNPPYTYLHLQLTSLPSTSLQSKSQPPPVLDEISLRQYLTSALNQSFGIMGSAMAIDILKVEGREAWLRVQSEDSDMLGASLSQWCSAKSSVGLRVLGSATWLGGLRSRDGPMKRERLWSLEV